jgi:endonuclease/exonuclease/phosphatase family metal-dependent hydrolase
MDAGRGDLARLVSDLEAGRLTGVAPADYVLLLQEAVDGGEHEAVARSRQLSAHYVAVRHDGRRLRGNALVSTLRLIDARAISLPRERQPRTAVAATIEVASRRLFVVSAHLENRLSWLRGGLLSDTARRRQAEALLQSLPPADPGILGGDMNTWLGEQEAAWQAFTRRFPDTPPGRPEPTFRDRLTLDHLFFDLPDGWLAASRVAADAYGSDHHPVVGVVSARRSPAVAPAPD